MELAETTADRIARNDATFREANEAIRARATELSAEMERVPFICECADLRCTQILRLPLAEYEAVRAHGRRFLMAPGHPDAAGEHGRIVEERVDYVVLEKTGRAGEVAGALDPRRGGSG